MRFHSYGLQATEVNSQNLSTTLIEVHTAASSVFRLRNI